MAIYDIDGNEIKITGSFDSAVVVKPIDVGGDIIVPFNGNGTYYFNPFSAQSTNTDWFLYNDQKAPIPIYDTNNNAVNRMDLSGSNKGKWAVQQRTTVTFVGTVIEVKMYTSYENMVAGLDSGVYKYHTDEVPKYMKATGRWTYNIYSDSEIETGLYEVKYNNEKYIGFFEQIDDYVQNNIGNSVLNRTTDLGQKIIRETVYQLNHTRDALRIGTYNAYSAGQGQTNWACMKNQLQDFGIDLCAFQEVRDPLNTEGTNKVWADEMTGWQFPYASENGTVHPVNERVCLSRYPIVSSSEYELDSWSSDKRCLAKYEIKLPVYKDRIGSDQLKLSVYNTQLEVQASNRRIDEARQIIADMANDKNPFVMICMDSNDFSADKEIWKMFEKAGYTLCIDPMSQTVRDQNEIIDQIFVNRNMRPLNSDVINSKRYKYRKGSSDVAVSDHNLCFADIQLIYDNICCVRQSLTHVTSDFDANSIQKGEPVTIHFTAESGYTISSASIKMGALWRSQIESGLTWANNTLTVESVTGDLNIIITATA